MSDPEKTPSYLLVVKTELLARVDALEQLVTAADDKSECADIFADWKRTALWPYIEDKLKESWRNGKNARGSGSDGKPAESRFSQFRPARGKG